MIVQITKTTIIKEKDDIERTWLEERIGSVEVRCFYYYTRFQLSPLLRYYYYDHVGLESYLRC